MKFNEAYLMMQLGKKIKLPEWKGFWAWENNTIMLHCSNGEVIDIRDTNDVAYTFSFICREDWTIVKEHIVDDVK